MILLLLPLLLKWYRGFNLARWWSFGAYELGAYKALCEKLIAKDSSNSENVRKNRPLFDIISGTSIGALNAVLITRSVVDGIRNSENANNLNIQKIWDKSVQELEKFWLDITLPFIWISKSNPLFYRILEFME